MKYASNTHKGDNTLINKAQPYGHGDFGEVGGSAVLELDTRTAADKTPGSFALRNLGYPHGGTLATVRGLVFPKAWDVKDTFGSVKGSAAAYLTPGSDKAPTLALRVGGEKTFGRYPYFQAAYLGGGLGRIGATGGEDPLQGLQRQQYAGDASLWRLPCPPCVPCAAPTRSSRDPRWRSTWAPVSSGASGPMRPKPSTAPAPCARSTPSTGRCASSQWAL